MDSDIIVTKGETFKLLNRQKVETKTQTSLYSMIHDDKYTDSFFKI